MLIVGSGILSLWREKARGTPLPPSVAADDQAVLMEEAGEGGVVCRTGPPPSEGCSGGVAGRRTVVPERTGVRLVLGPPRKRGGAALSEKEEPKARRQLPTQQ